MKKQITTIAMGLLMIGLASSMFAGENITFQTNLTDPVYTVAGNTSDLEGITVEFENGNITISSDPMMASDDFTMIFFDNITNEVIRTVSSGSSGGSYRTKYVDRNVATYVPEYINDTKEVEKIVEVDNPVYIQEGFSVWKVLLMGLVGFLSGLWIRKDWRKSDVEKTN